MRAGYPFTTRASTCRASSACIAVATTSHLRGRGSLAFAAAPCNRRGVREPPPRQPVGDGLVPGRPVRGIAPEPSLDALGSLPKLGQLSSSAPDAAHVPGLSRIGTIATLARDDR